jgi:hypothetical protein
VASCGGFKRSLSLVIVVHGDAELRMVSDEIHVHVLHSGRGLTDDVEYIMLSNIMSASERWEHAEQLRRKMAGLGIEKTPRCSSL